MDPTAQDQSQQTRSSTTNPLGQSPKGPSKNTLFTLVSLLILASVVGITLFLYIQNKTNIATKPSQKSNQNNVAPNQLVKNGNLEIKNSNISTINQQLAQAKNFKGAYLEANSLTSVPDALYNNIDLTTLWLPNNKITALSSQIQNLRNLTTINLISNQLTTLPPEIGTLTNLSELMLSNNNITSLPDSIANLKNLKTLMLEGNKLSNTEMTKIKSELPNTNITFGVQTATAPTTKPSR